ncbi:MAG: hypothetical protein KF729_18770 [Sandaracinaceae bacterium]|nr:hypothetical protein [Sandaracinaceae bacterium]
MSTPRYKPRAAFETRRASDEEVGEMPEFAATTIDRPAATVDDLRHAQLKQAVARDRREREAREQTRARMLWVALVVVALAVFFGALAGGYLAFR